jgi:hypothetical protein
MTNNATPAHSPRPTVYPAQLAVMVTDDQYDYVTAERERRDVSKAEIVREAIELHRAQTARELAD